MEGRKTKTAEKPGAKSGHQYSQKKTENVIRREDITYQRDPESDKETDIEDSDHDDLIQFGEGSLSSSSNLKTSRSDGQIGIEMSKEERVARLQQYRQGVWELNFDYRAFKRWRQVGVSKGLTDDTQIACFLLQQYEKSGDAVPQEPSVCAKCDLPLALCCPKCDLQPLPSSDFSNTDMDAKKSALEARVADMIPNGEEMIAELHQYLRMQDIPKIRKMAALRKRQHFSCTVCNMVFTRASSLNVHMRKHTGEKPFVCKDCGTAFTHSSSLSVHKRSHTGEKPFVCEECGAAFAVASVLKQHMRKHTGEKPYKCKLCEAAFTQSTKLTIHMRKHTGDRPYQCEHCGAAFTHSHRLKIHLRTHNGIKPYKCLDCEKAFAQSAHLTVHMRIHTGDKPFKCSDCGAAFLDSTHLRRHERTHSGEKLHKCAECGASYSTAFGLRRHEWSHTDHEKPYRCGECHKTFTTNFCLKRHEMKGRCKYQDAFPSQNTVDDS